MNENLTNTNLEGMEEVGALETTENKGSVLGAVVVGAVIIGAGVLLVKGTKLVINKIKAAKAAKAAEKVVVEEATEVNA